MSAKALQFIAAGIPAKLGPARSVLGRHNNGTASAVSSDTAVPTVLDRFMRDLESGRPDPFHRSPDREISSLSGHD